LRPPPIGVGMDNNPYRSPQENRAPPQVTLKAPVCFTGRLTQEDYQRIGDLHSGVSHKIMKILMYLAAVGAIVAVTMNIAGQLRRQGVAEFFSTRTISFYFQPVAAGVAFILVFGGWYWFRRKARKMSDQELGQYAPQAFELDEAGVHIRSKSTQTNISWDGFMQCKENGGVLSFTPQTGRVLRCLCRPALVR